MMPGFNNLAIEEKKAIADILDSGNIGNGEKTAELEQQISADTGYASSIALSSASLGIFIILKYSLYRF